MKLLRTSIVRLGNEGFRRFLLGVLWVYKGFISPWLGPRCRYRPTCSEYMVEALLQHGAFKGVGLGLGRLSRCHPWGRWGFDPVPPCEKTHEIVKRPMKKGRFF